MPESVSSHPADLASPPQTIPSELSEPLNLSPLQHEIAPSYHTNAAAIPGQPTDEDGRLRGLVIHRLLQCFSEAQAEEWMKVAVSVAAEFGLSPAAAPFRQWRQECESLLRHPKLDAIFAPPEGVETFNEVPIIYSHNGLTVNGTIDRLLLGPESAWVVDYKTHQHAKAETVADLAASYHQQLGYYSAGIQRLWPEKTVRSFLLFTACGLLHELDNTAAMTPEKLVSTSD